MGCPLYIFFFSNPGVEFSSLLYIYNNSATLKVEFRVTPFASTYADRRRINPNIDRTLLEQSQLLHKALEATLFLQLHPRTCISLTVYILSEDGGRLVAGINAASLACIDAGIEMRDVLCACSVGLVNSSTSTTTTLEDGETAIPWIDLNSRELQSLGDGMTSCIHMPMATLPQRDTVVLAQCDSRLGNLRMLEKLMEAGMEGCRQVFTIMEASIREHVGLILAAKNGNARILLKE